MRGETRWNNGILLLGISRLRFVFLIPIGTVFSKGFGRFLSMAAFLASVLYGISIFPSVMAQPQSVVIGNWLPPFGINLFISPFSLGVVILIFSAAFLVLFKDLQDNRRNGQYYLLYTLFVAASAGMVLTGDIFNLFVFLEIGGIASFSLYSCRGIAFKLIGKSEVSHSGSGSIPFNAGRNCP